MIDKYTLENTPGYTQAELDALNAELMSMLSGAAWGGTLSKEQEAEIITGHNAEVARQRPADGGIPLRTREGFATT
jgi:hypothetical protein